MVDCDKCGDGAIPRRGGEAFTPPEIPQNSGEPSPVEVTNFDDMPLGIEASLASAFTVIDSNGDTIGKTFIAKTVDEETGNVSYTKLFVPLGGTPVDWASQGTEIAVDSPQPSAHTTTRTASAYTISAGSQAFSIASANKTDFIVNGETISGDMIYQGHPLSDNDTYPAITCSPASGDELIITETR